ncbi:putative transcription factor ovo-like protein 3 [Porphyridium purpureum]|uniref:Putative transcription factor ovo-like protein 3 n=1 Tax=Porphyridium purpureum TaxID=35688 RepID=A0A5J4YMD6_PORPP|nr:putative transcription factor ovo-like protein 3 [Porphyridium purpureum]|eukprot:POR4999..scf244_11
MDSGFVSSAQYGFRRLRSFFQHFLPDVQAYLQLRRARRFDHPSGMPFASELRLVRVLSPPHNDQILRHLMMSGNASLVRVGQSSSGQPILSVMSNTCLAHYEFQALALDDDLRILNALCIVVRSSDEEIELLEVAEISNAYVLVSLVTFHRTKARKGTSLLLDGISGLEDSRLFDRVKGALTLEAHPTDLTPVPASQHQLDPRICADWDFWSAELPRWGIMKCMTRIEILSHFGLGDHEKAAIWFLADYLYLQPLRAGTSLGHHQLQQHCTPQQLPQFQQYPAGYHAVSTPSAVEWGRSTGHNRRDMSPGASPSYASSSDAHARPLKHPITANRSATDPKMQAAATTEGSLGRPSASASASVGPAVVPAGQGQHSSLEEHRSEEETPPSTRPGHTRTRRKPRFKCADCPAVFSRNSNLVRHVQVCHESIRRHVCDICGWAFAQRSDLKKHALKKHPNDYDKMCGATGIAASEQGPLNTADAANGVVEAEASFSQPIASNSEPGPSAPTSASGQQAPAVPASASEALDSASGSPRWNMVIFSALKEWSAREATVNRQPQLALWHMPNDHSWPLVAKAFSALTVSFASSVSNTEVGPCAPNSASDHRAPSCTSALQLCDSTNGFLHLPRRGVLRCGAGTLLLAVQHLLSIQNLRIVWFVSPLMFFADAGETMPCRSFSYSSEVNQGDHSSLNGIQSAKQETQNRLQRKR